ncbi:MAG: hypothetical protein KF774_07885 [Planctomyces sp.]|nr:hypothetical protein [Planctomyces sp.]
MAVFPRRVPTPRARSAWTERPGRTAALSCALAAALLAPGHWGNADDRAATRPAQPEFRPPDVRPQHDAAEARRLGIERYESTHLLLYADIEPDVARTLPPLIDQAVRAFEDYFGPLPPDREGRPFQMTGFVMRDRERFIAAGMLRDDLPSFEHGRHRGAEFWMDDQPFDYYRRHLLIHEATHCYMTYVPRPRLPLWHFEGMAELFAVHRLDADGRAEFRARPEPPADFQGFGRVAVIRRAVRDGGPLTVRDILALNARDFAPQTSEPYAGSWALCLLLDQHPRYRDRYHELTRLPAGADVSIEFQRTFQSEAWELAAEWDHFTRTLTPGFDFDRNAIEFVEGRPLNGAATIDVAADRGWQSTGILAEAGQRYAISASGEATLRRGERPWISRPAGITIRYANGHPIGRLEAAVLPPRPESKLDRPPRVFATSDVGDRAVLVPEASGTLYLRINDATDSLADNAAGYRVEIRAASPDEE